MHDPLQRCRQAGRAIVREGRAGSGLVAIDPQPQCAFDHGRGRVQIDDQAIRETSRDRESRCDRPGNDGLLVGGGRRKTLVPRGGTQELVKIRRARRREFGGEGFFFRQLRMFETEHEVQGTRRVFGPHQLRGAVTNRGGCFAGDGGDGRRPYRGTR